jgi:hypothetical protein
MILTTCGTTDLKILFLIFPLHPMRLVLDNSTPATFTRDVVSATRVSYWRVLASNGSRSLVLGLFPKQAAWPRVRRDP